MKNTIRLFSFAALSLTLAVGCKPSDERTSEPATETPQEQMTRTETAEAGASQDLEAYTFEQRSQFIESMEAELETINRNIDELAARLESSSEEVRATATPRLNELRNQADLLEAHLDEARDATASTWDTVKATTRETYDNLHQNFDDARQWMSDTIEP